ncbi:hypothetical protein [Stenoxybacter acetivorans]|uniref:hypothetical protein n=1 Tax=Stenoxybacter acetivorans TaxID=422441 RepID=UPI0005680D7E|nr:hypothetical protein [Stenoxybacter acetivorans]
MFFLSSKFPFGLQAARNALSFAHITLYPKVKGQRQRLRGLEGKAKLSYARAASEVRNLVAQTLSNDRVAPQSSFIHKKFTIFFKNLLITLIGYVVIGA